jgi:spermidine synthase
MCVEDVSEGFEAFCPSDPKEHPYIADDGETRGLHFDARCIQSAMRLDDPFALVFGYTRLMMGFLLLAPKPRDILIVGLGGGSLSKYCYQELPDSTVTTVEISAAVINMRNEFAIPPESDKFRIVHADAALYMRKQREAADVILLDGYDPAGLPLALSSPAFYDACFRALRPGGVLAANLWGSSRGRKLCFDRLGQSFAGRTLLAKPDTSNNRVAFGFKHIDMPSWAELQIRARRWERLTGFNFTGMLDQWRERAENAEALDWLMGRARRRYHVSAASIAAAPGAGGAGNSRSER